MQVCDSVNDQQKLHKSKMYHRRFDFKSNDLDAFRQSGDPIADQVIELITRNNSRKDLYDFFLLKSFDEIHSSAIREKVLIDFLCEGNELPNWVDDDKVRKASELFRNNGNEFLFMLGIVSLPYCYAAAKGALSLYHTEKIRKNTEARLLDTTSFIVDIMQKEAFSSGGLGFLAVKQVRLRHALARYYLKNVPQIKALDEVPINQEDMAGTNLAFSYVALREMPKIGVQISQKTKDAYIHFWSLVGYLLGIKEILLPKNIREAFWLEKRIAHRQFRASKEGKELTGQLINHYKAHIPNSATIALIKPLIRYLLGEEVSEIIGMRSKGGVYPQDALMKLLPIFKRVIFPPVQSFEAIVAQIDQRKKPINFKT